MTATTRIPAPVDPGLLSRALEVAGRLANDAAEVIAATAGRAPGSAAKSDPFDWVTDTDRTLERHTRRVLAAEFPEVPVIGEEYGGEADPAGLRWIVDPVDGTANYVAGLPWCAYSLGLVDADGPVVGVIADPSRATIYAAARGRGVRANGAPVPTLSGTTGVVGGLVCAESPSPALVERARARHTGIRVLGSSALAITQVALGRAVAAVVDGYHEWDVAGAVCLALEAGAVVVDRAGRPEPLPAGGLLVGAPAVVEEVYSWWAT
ncbi:inositol monophosphatase family protein [Pseudonocardia sp. WMMC193]|uniref:inositol monophosphatase family protein n=1 Tax=Pseudonocardia sp. WMMC193 TaxID=2911965 RepID=UPI001F2603C3|nr:inositol monophosphatase family protein [Pseudonocardia sp. WMMC193]MCF7552984.1 inositol monophosphatase [Pseudonocardia sp. WMMC193]